MSPFITTVTVWRGAGELVVTLGVGAPMETPASALDVRVSVGGGELTDPVQLAVTTTKAVAASWLRRRPSRGAPVGPRLSARWRRVAALMPLSMPAGRPADA